MKALSIFPLILLAAFGIPEAQAMRWYSPSTGKWLSRDPIGERGGVNLFAYVDNDTINQTDRFGLMGTTCDGKRSCIKDCHWTGTRNAGRITGSSNWSLFWHNVGKIPWIPDVPPAKAHWDDMCYADEWVDDAKTVSKPTPGSGDIGIIGKGGEMSIESRYFAPTWVDLGNGVKGMDKSDADATKNSSGDFCCCRAFPGIET